MAYHYATTPNMNIGEKFDGRIFFHERRHNVHLDIIKWSQKAVKDPQYLAEWCASLMALHRMLWGSLEKVNFKFRNKRIPFNRYMEKKLFLINQKILDSFTYYERANGEVYIKTDRAKLKGLYNALDKAHKQLAEIEYKKNLDLPKSGGMVEDCTTGGM